MRSLCSTAVPAKAKADIANESVQSYYFSLDRGTNNPILRATKFEFQTQALFSASYVVAYFSTQFCFDSTKEASLYQKHKCIWGLPFRLPFDQSREFLKQKVLMSKKGQ